MSALLKRAHRVLLIAVAAVFGLTLLAPVATLANTDIQIGQQATISNPNGTGANLRTDPVLDDTALIGEIPQGATVAVTDGPYVNDAGTWFWVVSDVGEGFVSADMLGAVETAPAEEPATEETTEPETEEAPVSPDLLWQEPVESGFVVDNNNTLPAEGLACRTTATVDGEVITRVPANATLQVAGPRIWQGEQSFVHINCGNGAGYVNGAFVVLESEQVTEPVVEEPVVEEPVVKAPVVEEPVVEEPVVEEPVVEEPVVEAPVVEEPVVEAPVVEEPVVEAPVVEEPVVEEPVVEEPVVEAPVVEEPVVEEPVTEATGETGTRFIIDNVNLRAGASGESEVMTVLASGEQVELTGVVGNGYAQVNAAAGSGFVAQEFLGTEAPVVAEPTAPAVPTEAPVEPVAPAATVAPTEIPAEPTVEVAAEAEAPAGEVSEAPATNDVPEPADVPTESTGAEVDAPAADEAVENADDNAVPVVEDAGSAEQSAVVEAPAADEAVENADENADPVTDAATVAGTPVVTDEPAAEAAPAEAPAESAAPAEPVAEETVEAETPTAVPTGQPEEEQPAAPAVTAPAFDASAMIGSATVTGTNGDGLICRVSPEEGAATLMVLSEGTRVLVSAEPVNGYLGIDCGGLQGFADVNFLWSGGAGDEEIQKASMSLVVSGTGNGLNCRTGASTSYPVITVLRDGTTLSTRAAASNGWVAVVCGGQNGFVSTPYVEVSGGSASASTSTTSGTATVSNTNGDGLYCRTGAGTSYSAITVLAPGQSVSVRGANQGSWTPIVCGGTNGFAHSSFLTVGSGSGSTSGPSAPGTSTGTVTVANTGGQGLNCRTGAGTSNSVITVLRPGQAVDTRSGSTSGWQAVICGGQNGFVSSQFVTGGGSTSPAPEAPATGSGGTATVSNTNGDGLYCRSGAGTGNSVITVLSPGQSVSVRGAASNGWLPITCGGKAGWASSQFLTIGGSSSPAPSNPAPAPAPSGLQSGDHARTTATLNLRYSPSLGSGIATAAPAGTVVLITGGASSGFYPVDWDGLQGYMSGDYLAGTSEALSQRGGSASPGTTTPPSSGGGTATGNAIVDYAMRYVGYPYVWATHGPASFDCSGFTYWVIKNVTGKDIGYGTWTQVSAGTPVSRSNLQPGDLIFFQNTYTAGLSHVGIYIGNNKMINALNENAGVVVNDITSTYWSTRWYGAVRI